MLHEKRLEKNIYLIHPVKREYVLIATACRGRSNSINMCCRSFTAPVAPPPSATSSQIDVCLIQEEGNADVFVSLTWFTHHRQLQSGKFSQTLVDGKNPLIRSLATKGKVVFAVAFLFHLLKIFFPAAINVSITVSLERHKVAGTKEQQSDFWVHYLIKSFRTLF